MYMVNSQKEKWRRMRESINTHGNSAEDPLTYSLRDAGPSWVPWYGGWTLAGDNSGRLHVTISPNDPPQRSEAWHRVSAARTAFLEGPKLMWLKFYLPGWLVWANNNYFKGWLILIETFLCDSHSTQCFTCVSSFNPYLSPRREWSL